MPPFDLIALDADDTLWHNETLYRASRNEFVRLLADVASEDTIVNKLDQIEGRNLEPFGFGIKAYTLSLIETAVELTDGQVSGRTVAQIVQLAHEMVDAPVELLDGVAETLPVLAEHNQLMLLTKGDLLDQERKLRRSGLAQYFSAVEIVSNKNTSGYAAVLQRHNLSAARFMMVGNSLRSDVVPVLELGGSGVFIPFEITWLHESAETPSADRAGFYELKTFSELPNLIEKLNHQA
jgi:putative hydrolase of the HAD superfamily